MTKDELLLWRRARGYTQAELAEMLGVRRESVARWEKGIHTIPQDVLVKLEAKNPDSIKNLAFRQPAITDDKRWRPFPWGNRDYHLDKEVPNLKTGTKVWRMYTEAGHDWEVLQAWKQNSFHRCEPHITLPAECFPDPMGIEAPGARELFAQREARYNAERAGLRQALKDAGIAEE